MREILLKKINNNMNEPEFFLEKKHQQQTIFLHLIQISIKVHGIYIPSSALQNRLHDFAFNLVYYTHDETYEVQLIGSATGIEFGGRRILISTQHQIKDCRPSDIGTLRVTKNSYLSSSGIAFIKASKNSSSKDEFDLCAFDYTPASKEDIALARKFFLLDEDSVLLDGDKPIAFLAYGYPFDHQKYNVCDRNHVGLVSKSITCRPIEGFSDEMLGSCRTLSNMDFDPNGLSGGPIFATILVGDEIVLKFAGIINRAGNGFVHFIKAKAVARLLTLGFD